ncbi:acyl-CoA dehydrogenase [bacterium]|nr:acyl-CoA dehydrogenase [bacterium]
MAEKFISQRNLNFLLYEVLDIETLSQYPYFEDHGRETYEMLIDTSIQMAKDIMHPAFVEMDQIPPEFKDGEIKVHRAVKDYLRELGRGGWIAAGFPFDNEGQQFPTTLVYINFFIASAANFSLAAYSGLTSAASHLILEYGSDELKETYLPKMLTGEWQGTMAMTEPSTGSSISDITASGVANDGKGYLIKGQKIFISGGDHDAVDNNIHMMLARIKGAPAGKKGVSLFLVPKKRLGDNGELESNDVTCIGTYHKLGYRGCPIAQLSMGDNHNCRGYLIGEPGRGLEYMFKMINEVRLGIGIQATACATAAYYDALEYARERSQGRSIKDKSPENPQVPLIEHADVKRMFLFQKSVAEGSLSLALYTAKLTDLARVTEGEEQENYMLLLDLLIPIVKSYPAEAGILSTSQAIQCLGGYGFCDEFPVEQHFRNSRIHPIHGGTTGIQGIDLLGRKIMMNNGKAWSLFLDEVKKASEEAENFEELQAHAKDLTLALRQLRDVTSHLLKLSGQKDVFLANATLYLEMFGIVSIAWQWLIQGTAAQKGLADTSSETETLFYQGKIYSLRYFFKYELPKIEGLAITLKRDDRLTLEISKDHFVE